MPSNLPACCQDFDIELRQLVFPDTLDEAGWEFLRAHGLDGLTLAELRHRAVDLGLQANGERKIKLRHRCAQLADDGRCRIYAHRPAICREYDCGRRKDGCACGGRGVVPEKGVAVWRD